MGSAPPRPARAPRGGIVAAVPAVALALVPAVFLGVLLLTACGGTDATPSVGAPPVPAGLAGLEPDLVGAIDAALARCATDPGAAPARLALGMLYDANALVGPAAEAYAQALALDPGLAPAAYHLAIARESFGELEPAIALMQRVTELAPDEPTAHGRLGQWLLEAGRFDAADAAFARAAALAPDHPVGPEGRARLALTRGDPARAVVLLRAWLERHPERRHGRYLLSIALRESGDLEGAQRELAAATPSSPGWKDPWRTEVLEHVAGYHAVMDAAVELGRSGQAAEALPSLELLHDGDPGDVAVIEKLIGGYLQTRRLDDAQRRIERSLAARPDHPRFLFLQALVHEAAGRPREALLAADAAVSRQGSWTPLHELRARLLWNAGDVGAAADALQRALDVGGDDLADLLKLGRARGLAGDWPAARDSFLRVTVAYPTHGQGWALLAEAELECGELPAARAAIERALAIDARDSNVRRVATRLATLPGADG